MFGYNTPCRFSKELQRRISFILAVFFDIWNCSWLLNYSVDTVPTMIANLQFPLFNWDWIIISIIEQNFVAKQFVFSLAIREKPSVSYNSFLLTSFFHHIIFTYKVFERYIKYMTCKSMFVHMSVWLFYIHSAKNGGNST